MRIAIFRPLTSALVFIRSNRCWDAIGGFQSIIFLIPSCWITALYEGVYI